MPDSDLPENGRLPPRGEPLAGRTVLITGAGGDLGAAAGVAAARAGARVLMLDRKRRVLEAPCDRIEVLGTCQPAMIEFDTDTAQEADYRTLAEGIAGLAGTLDGLVHCALSAWPLAAVVNSRVEEWHRVHEREVVRPMVLVRALFPLLDTPRDASVVFCTLGAGRRGRANWGAVGSAYAALENLSETLSAEWEDRGIRVNTLDISELRTDLRTRYYPGEVADRREAPDGPGFAETLVRLLDAGCTTSGERIAIPPDG